MLIARARILYRDDNDFSLEINNTVYALDATTIDLCLSVFWWAKFRKKKAAIKLHKLLDLRGDIPTFIQITDGLTHEVNILDQIAFEPGAFYVMDRGYFDLKRLFRIHLAQAFFVIRARVDLDFRRIRSAKINKDSGLRCDQSIKLNGFYSALKYPQKLRRVKFYDKDQDKTYVFLTNNFDLEPLDIALLYKYRWKVELFFKWIKQHLKIKSFWGESENAVKTQIWIAICTYLLAAITKKELRIERNLYEILQILSVSAFDKTPLNQILNQYQLQISSNPSSNQLSLLDL